MIHIQSKINKLSLLLFLGVMIWCIVLFGGIFLSKELILIKIIFGILWVILTFIEINYFLKVNSLTKILSELKKQKNIRDFFSTMEKFPILKDSFDAQKIFLQKVVENYYFSMKKLSQNQLILLREIAFYLDSFQFDYKISGEFLETMFSKNDTLPVIIIEPNTHRSEAISTLIEGFNKEADKIYPLLCEKIIDSNHHEVDIDEVVVYTFTFQQGKDKIKLSFL